MKYQTQTGIAAALCCLAIPAALSLSANAMPAPFTDQNFYSGCVEQSFAHEFPDEDIPVDGLTDAQLARITIMHCYIAGDPSNPESELNTSGIEKLTSLEYLDLSNQAISSIDLSSNTALRWLDLSNNPIIATLDLSHNQNLEQLKVQDTPLSSLDLSNNQHLAYINIENTNINSLDISAFGWALHTLYANNNLTVFTEGATSNLCEGEDPIVCDYGALGLVSRVGGTPQYVIDDTANYTFDRETGYLTVTNPEGTGGYIVARNTHTSGGEQIRIHLFDIDSDDPVDTDTDSDGGSDSSDESSPQSAASNSDVAAPDTGSFTDSGQGASNIAAFGSIITGILASFLLFPKIKALTTKK